MELQGQSQRLPCGCVIATRIVNRQREFVVEPCAPDCQYFRFMLEESTRQSKSIEYRIGELKGEPKDV